MLSSNLNTVSKEVNQVIIDLLIQSPFYGRLLSKTVKVIHPKYFGISLNQENSQVFQLCINPSFWKNSLKGDSEKQTLQLRKIAFKKQVIHFIFNHDGLFHDFENNAFFILAAELVASQYLDDESSFKHLFNSLDKLELQPFKPLIYYYHSILDNFKNKNFEKVIDLNDSQFDYWKNWKEQPINSETALKWQFRKDFILNAFQSRESHSHTFPPLTLYLNELENENSKPINWKRILHLFCNSSNQTKIANTIHKKSKRYGTFPGTRIRKHSRILIALDSSGSINEPALEIFFNEIHLLWKQNTEIRILECDTHIHKNYEYKGKKLESVKGRGNTDFNQPIQYANEKYQPDALIYFTDGFGPKPRIKSKKPLLWVIHHDGIKKESKAWEELPGRKVRMLSNV